MGVVDRWWRVGVGALLVVTMPALAGCQGRVEPPGSQPSRAERATLRAQLAADPGVVREMLGRAHPRGTMLCGLRVLGRDGSRLYAWVMCEDFRVGADAAALSGTSEPAVLTVTGQGDTLRLVEAEFPRQATLEADIDQMFPPPIARVVRAGDVRVSPDEAGLLAEARALG